MRATATQFVALAYEMSVVHVMRHQYTEVKHKGGLKSTFRMHQIKHAKCISVLRKHLKHPFPAKVWKCVDLKLVCDGNDKISYYDLLFQYAQLNVPTIPAL